VPTIAKIPITRSIASEAATAAATAASSAATAAAAAATAAASAAAEAASAAAKAVATAASAAATAAATATTANDSRIGRLEIEQGKLAADVGLIKQEQAHLREIMTGRFGVLDTAIGVISEKLDDLKTGSDEAKGALAIVRFLGVSGLATGAIALLTMILKFSGTIR